PRSPARGFAAGGSRANGSSAIHSSDKPFVASWMTAKSPSTSQESSPKGASPEGHSIDNIARFFGGKAGHGKPGALPRPAASAPAMDLPVSSGAVNLKKGQH